MTNKNSRFAVIAALALTGGIWTAGKLRAFNPQPDPPGRFAPFGITANETARLVAVNTTFFAESNARPCAVALQIFDGAGNLLKRDVKLLRARQTGFIDVTGTEALMGRAMRGEIWAAAATEDPKRCPVRASFELFDNGTQRTLIAIGDPGI